MRHRDDPACRQEGRDLQSASGDGGVRSRNMMVGSDIGEVEGRAGAMRRAMRG